MTAKRLLTEFGMGTSLRRLDYTSATRKALQDALWHNSINLAELFDLPKEAMQISVDVGVQQPDLVKTEELVDIFPYGQISFNVTKGGLDIPRPDGNPTIIANVAITVSLDVEAKSMRDQRFIIEMGMGNDLHGMDYTKAGKRAIEDAFRHSSIPMFSSLGIDPSEMRVHVTVAVQEPDKVDTDALTATLPRGRASVTAVHGGLNVEGYGNDTIVVASAAIEAFLPKQV